MKINNFNIRVYGICLNEKKEILILKEKFQSEILYKFPGGGLEFGEGILDCLRREFFQELNLKFHHYQHFYTQEDFLVSKFKENDQIITIYYVLDIENFDHLKIEDSCIEEVIWWDLNQKNPLNLPIDKKVYHLLQKKLKLNIK